jgi:hypothetical protein
MGNRIYRLVQSAVMLSTALVLLLPLSASATDYDLTSTGATATVNGALFKQISPQSTGTGVLDPFLRVQADNVEEGYNTSAKPAPMDDKSGSWTHDLLLSSLAVTNIGGSAYYGFMLDVNENSGDSNNLVSLDAVQIYTSTTAGQNTGSLTSLVGSLRFNLDAASDNTVLLDYALNSGSGSGDMLMFVPTANFSAVPTAEKYLILYSHFGGKGGGFSTSDGFEEWADLAAIPEPGSAVLAGFGMALLLLVRRRRR